MQIADTRKHARALVASVVFTLLAACGGGGGDDGDDGGGNEPPPSGGTATISGRITFDRVPVGSSGLNFAAVVESPAREVTVEAISATGSNILASTTTDASGNYSLSVPANTQLFVRAKAAMAKTGTAPTYNFQVLNNMNSNALYALDGSTFNSGTGATTRSLRAASGWGGSSYTGTRAAAPFAILDTIYQAKGLLVAAEPTMQMPALNLFWSGENRSSDRLCPATGEIGTTSYITFGGQNTECTPATAGSDGIYVLGATVDSDEFDQHVMAHEFGHYVEDRFSRSDSTGGPHGSGDRLDPRLAFGEGWGNAFSAMVLNDPVYRDSNASGASGFNLDNNALDIEGWYSEASIGQILWDIFDGGTEPGDAVALGFGPIYAALVNQRNTDALTTIYPFTQTLRTQNAAASAAVGALESAEQIEGRGDFGEGETNDGGDELPLYEDVTVGAPIAVCSRANFGRGNKLGNRRFLRLTLADARTVTINVNAAVDPGNPLSQPAQDPDVYVWRRGERVGAANGEGPSDSTGQLQLPAGVYVVEVFDYAYGGEPASQTSTTPRCMTVSIAG